MNKQVKLKEFEKVILPKYKKGLIGFNGICGWVRDLIDQAEQEKAQTVREIVKKFLPRLTKMDDRSLIVECLQEQEEHVHIKGLPVTGNLAIALKDGE